MRPDEAIVILGLTILLVSQLAGEAIVRGLALPVPGPVLGLAILLVGLDLDRRLGRRPEGDAAQAVGRVADGLLAHLALLFVPAGVGVVQHLGTIRAHLWPIGMALVGSTLVTLLVTVGVFLMVKRLMRRVGDEAS